MKVLLLDNYDSFTYNLLHIVKELGAQIEVRRNDQITLDEVERFDKILLSPGPGIPEEAGILLPLIRRYAPTKSILGVCLGEQAIGEAFGAKLVNLTEVYHGISSDIQIVAHSWVVSREQFPNCLEVTAVDTEKNYIMALRHRTYDVRGIQFHPESVLTPEGKRMIQNWTLNN